MEQTALFSDTLERPGSAFVQAGVQRPSMSALGQKRTFSDTLSNVCFQGPATGPAGAEDVTNLQGVGHGYVGV